jgi:predicted TIM-barrel fold metal-dependent hydrolase
MHHPAEAAGLREDTMTGRAWRDLVVEAPLDPDLPIIDAHHHLWETAPAEGFERYTTEELLADTIGAGHNIVSTVYVDARSGYRRDGPEALRPVGETEYAEAIAEDALRRGGRAAGICAAIVPFADLMLGARVGEVLDAHRALSPRLRGIRFMTAFDPDLPPVYGAHGPGLTAEPAFREGFAELAPRGLSFDAWMFHPQLPDVVDLARAFPETSIVLDHLGGPLGIGRYAGRRAEGFAEWRANLAEVAACPNVVLKIGSLNMSYTALDATGAARPRSSEATAIAQRDHILTAIDLFGPDRCMFESNFPVDMVSIAYGILWNGFKRVAEGFSPAERRALFAGTAARVYRLPAPAA